MDIGSQNRTSTVYIDAWQDQNGMQKKIQEGICKSLAKKYSRHDKTITQLV